MALNVSRSALRVVFVLVLSAAGLIGLLIGLVWAQNPPNIVWQASPAGNAIAISADGQFLLSGIRLFRAADGTLLLGVVGHVNSFVVIDPTRRPHLS